MPTVARADTIVSGFSTLPDDAERGVDTYGPIRCGGHPVRVEQDSDQTRRGDLARDNKSANSSSRLCGFCTMPVTRRVVPSWRQRLPTLRRKAVATPLVTATWAGASRVVPAGPARAWAARTARAGSARVG